MMEDVSWFCTLKTIKTEAMKLQSCHDKTRLANYTSNLEIRLPRLSALLGACAVAPRHRGGSSLVGGALGGESGGRPHKAATWGGVVPRRNLIAGSTLDERGF